MKTGWTKEILERALENVRGFMSEVIEEVYRAEKFSDSLSWKLAKIVEYEIEVLYLERVLAYADEMSVDEARQKAATELIEMLTNNAPKLETVHGTIEQLRHRSIYYVLRRYGPHTITIEV